MEIATFAGAALVGLVAATSIVATVRAVSRDGYHKAPERAAH